MAGPGETRGDKWKKVSIYSKVPSVRLILANDKWQIWKEGFKISPKLLLSDWSWRTSSRAAPGKPLPSLCQWSLEAWLLYSQWVQQGRRFQGFKSSINTKKKITHLQGLNNFLEQMMDKEVIPFPLDLSLYDFIALNCHTANEEVKMSWRKYFWAEANFSDWCWASRLGYDWCHRLLCQLGPHRHAGGCHPEHPSPWGRVLGELHLPVPGLLPLQKHPQTLPLPWIWCFWISGLHQWDQVDCSKNFE